MEMSGAVRKPRAAENRRVNIYRRIYVVESTENYTKHTIIITFLQSFDFIYLAIEEISLAARIFGLLARLDRRF